MGFAQFIIYRYAEQQKPAGSYQAFIKLLRKWTEPLLKTLSAAFRQRMIQTLAAVWMVEGWLIFAVDGSRVDVPRTRKNEERYSLKSKLSRAAQKRRRKHRRRQVAQAARERKANTPRIWLTMLWHVGSGLPWDWRTGPSDSSERGHFQEMLGSVPVGCLRAADAGFVGVWRAYRRAMREYKSPPDPGERMKQLLDRAMIDPYERKNKASRDHPRKKQEQATGPPILRKATRPQVQQAMQVKREQKKGITA